MIFLDLGTGDIIAIIGAGLVLIGLPIAWLTYREAKRTRKMSEPKIEVATILEGFDTRDSAHFIVWYWNLRVTNSGGKSVSLLDLGRKNKLPVITAATYNELQETPISFSLHVGEKPEFEQMAPDKNYFKSLTYKSWEELQSLNISIPAGESRSIIIVLHFDRSITNASRFLINLVLRFNNSISYDLTKMIQLK